MGITLVMGCHRRHRLALVTSMLAVTLLACTNLEATVTAARATPTVPPTPVTTPAASPTPDLTRYSSTRIVPLTGGAPGTPVMGTPLPDDRVAEILALMLQREPDLALMQAALDEIVDAGDVRFIAPLVELMRAGPMQLAELNEGHVDALATLSGWRHSQSWDRWSEWYAGTDLVAPPGFATWKGTMLSRLDARYAEFLNDDRPSAIRVEELIWSGTNPDDRVPLDAPRFVAAASPEAAYLQPGEPVFGVSVNGEVRAYPLRIMDVHEIANDVVGGVPVTLAYCPLTGSSALYDRRAPNGQTYSFSSSGLVHRSNRLMYDRETGSLWSPLTGRPVIGDLVTAAQGTSGPWLDRYPIVTARWEDWHAMHPDTLVLSQDTGLGTGYAPGFPHLEYFSSGDAAYPVASDDARQLTKAWVYGVHLEGVSKAYPVRTVFREGVVNDRINDTSLVVVGDGQGRGIRVTGEMPGYGEVRYFVGGTVRAYQRPAGVAFAPGPSSESVVDQHGGAWRVTEEALISPTGEVAPRIVGQLSYWLGWREFYPHTTVYDPPVPTAVP